MARWTHRVTPRSIRQRRRSATTPAHRATRAKEPPLLPAMEAWANRAARRAARATRARSPRAVGRGGRGWWRCPSRGSASRVARRRCHESGTPIFTELGSDSVCGKTASHHVERAWGVLRVSSRRRHGLDPSLFPTARGGAVSTGASALTGRRSSRSSSGSFAARATSRRLRNRAAGPSVRRSCRMSPAAGPSACDHASVGPSSDACLATQSGAPLR